MNADEFDGLGSNSRGGLTTVKIAMFQPDLASKFQTSFDPKTG
jgi:hypothetical protein